jgi:general secretion pathway protein A
VYRAFFGFKEKPFNLTPDPKFLYLNASYREALAALHYGVVDRKGFVSLIGEAGTGKTTLLRRLLSELPRETRSVLVINPAIGFEEMLRFILTDLGRPPAPGATKLDMLEALNAELLDTLARGGNVVVLIDEAQDLTIPVLEELRLLSNLETAKEKILQLVLAGQPEFDGLLARPEIRQLRQRISVRARLRPLARSEVQAYVAARIAAAGGDVRGLFTKPALFRLWRFSGGVPRLVNAACDNALITAYAAGRRTIGWREMGEAMRDLRRQVPWAPRRFASGFATLAIGAVVGVGSLLAVDWFRGGQLSTTIAGAPVAEATPLAEPRPETAAIPPAVVADARAVAPPETGEPAVAEIEPTPLAAEVVAAIAASPAETVAPTEVPTEAATPEPPTITASAIDVPSPETTPGPEPAATADATARVAPSEPGPVRVRVTEGDTLTELAVRYYGNAGPRVLEAIRDANPWLRDPDILWKGKIVTLPGARVAVAPSPSIEEALVPSRADAASDMETERDADGDPIDGDDGATEDPFAPE